MSLVRGVAEPAVHPFTGDRPGGSSGAGSRASAQAGFRSPPDFDRSRNVFEPAPISAAVRAWKNVRSGQGSKLGSGTDGRGRA